MVTLGISGAGISSAGISSAGITAVAATASATTDPTLRLVGESSSVPPDGTASFTVETTSAPAGSVITLDVYLPVDGDAAAVTAATQGVVRGQQFFPGLRVDVTASVGPDHRVTLWVPTSRDDRSGTFHLRSPGLYPVVIKLLDGTKTLAQVTSFLVRTDATSRPVDVAVVIPIDSPPTLQPDGTRRLDDLVRAQLVSVDRMSHLAPEVPLTLAIRPDVIDALSSSTASEDVALARRLAETARRGEVIIDTDVAIDPTRAARLGLSEVYGRRLRAGTQMLGRWLGSDPVDSGTRYAWSPLDRDGLRVARSGGLTTVVTEPTLTQSLSVADQTARGPVALLDRDGTTSAATAIVGSADLARLMRTTDEPFLAARNFLAGIEALSPTGSAAQPGVALVLPARWQVAPGDALEQLLALLRTSAAIQPVTVGQLRADVAAQRAANGIPVTTSFQAPDAIPTRDVGAQITLVQLDIAALASMTTGLTADPTTLLAAAASTRLTESQRAAYFAAAKTSTEPLRHAIDPVGDSRFTLGSAGKVTIPLRLTSKLTQPLRVRLHFSQVGAKATFPQNDKIVTLVNGLVRENVPIDAREGQYPIIISIFPPDGGEALTTGTITLTAFALGGISIAVTASAGVILMTWWISHARKARRRKQSLVDSLRHPANTQTG